jgi:hypothetical protein
LLKQIPLNSFGQAEDIASAALFLAVAPFAVAPRSAWTPSFAAGVGDQS